MHEQSLVRALVQQIDVLARAHRAQAVRKVMVSTGVLGHGSAEHLRDYFRREAKGTLAEGAILDITPTGDLIDLKLDSLELELPA